MAEHPAESVVPCRLILIPGIHTFRQGADLPGQLLQVSAQPASLIVTQRARSPAARYSPR
jgi:hypothetical protein